MTRFHIHSAYYLCHVHCIISNNNKNNKSTTVTTTKAPSKAPLHKHHINMKTVGAFGPGTGDEVVPRGASAPHVTLTLAPAPLPPCLFLNSLQPPPSPPLFSNLFLFMQGGRHMLTFKNGLHITTTTTTTTSTILSSLHLGFPEQCRCLFIYPSFPPSPLGLRRGCKLFPPRTHCCSQEACITTFTSLTTDTRMDTR
ncbi:hypothetical protein E2C01_051778 [Portunus trituberculatus]|uniref:Uncharacterized protein n=1 Tax=Portunus trituberculatus TaxID=210409 RepID=A0A5B7GBX7_PORTR|nr:hypothetical protein [Portunus trituberculatus]